MLDFRVDELTTQANILLFAQIMIIKYIFSNISASSKRTANLWFRIYLSCYIRVTIRSLFGGHVLLFNEK